MPLISDADMDLAIQAVTGATAPNVRYGNQSCYGDLKRLPVHEATVSGLTRVGTHITLFIRSGALTGLVDDTTIKVDGVPYSIRDIGTAQPDGSRVLALVDA